MPNDSYYLIEYYNWQQRHQFNDGLHLQRRNACLNLCPELAYHYNHQGEPKRPTEFDELREELIEQVSQEQPPRSE